MGKTYRRSDGDSWDDDDFSESEMRHARKQNKFKRKERHRAETILEMNERVDNDGATQK